MKTNTVKQYFHSQWRLIMIVGLMLVFLLSQFMQPVSALSRPRPGYIMAYSQQGRYEKVRIRPYTGADVAFIDAHSCSGRFSTPTSHNFRRLKKVGPRAIKCSRVTNSEMYVIQYGKGNFGEASYQPPHGTSDVVIQADIDEKRCTVIHPVTINTNFTPDLPTEVTSSAGCVAEPDTISKIDSTAALTAAISKSKKYLAGTIDVRAVSGEHLTKSMCGNLTAVINYDASNNSYDRSSSPVRFKYKKITSATPARCLAKFTSRSVSPSLEKDVAYTVNATTQNTATHLNVTTSNSSSAITLPKYRE
jgi:hypothetical protein